MSELNLTIRRLDHGRYIWSLANQDSIGAGYRGEASSISAALKSGMKEVQTMESVDVMLIMDDTDDFDIYTADMPSRRAAAIVMAKSETPDYEKGAAALLAAIR